MNKGSCVCDFFYQSWRDTREGKKDRNIPGNICELTRTETVCVRDF